MAVPYIRIFRTTFSDTDAVGTINTATDLNSGLDSILLLKPNTIVDVVNEKDPSSIEVEVQIWKNGKDTSVRFYSTMMSPDTSGRMSPAPIDLTPGNYQIKVKLLTNNLASGSSETYGVALKFARNPE